MSKLVGLFAVMTLVTTNALAQDGPSWYFHYTEADQAGDISACLASVDFNNAYFTARLYGENFDFVYYRDDFTLPYDQTLGRAIFHVDDQSFLVTASTNARSESNLLPTAQAAFFDSAPSERGRLFSALRDGLIFYIEFPNGDIYEFPLGGSGRAFSAASDCWNSRPTGPFSNNPFVPQTSSNNPFVTQ